MQMEYHGVYDSAFAEFIIQHALLQYVHSPTRRSNILDLVFCDDPYSICNLNITHPFSTSDHNAIEFQLCCDIMSQSNPLSTNNISKYYFKKADWEGVADEMSTVDWNFVFNNDINDLYDAFCDTLFSIIDKFVPKTSNHRSSPTQRLLS